MRFSLARANVPPRWLRRVGAWTSLASRVRDLERRVVELEREAAAARPLATDVDPRWARRRQNPPELD